MLPPQVILKSEPVHPFGLAVYGEHIFWTDWVRRAVQRANKYVGSDMKLLRVDIPQQPMGIIAVANDTNSCEWGHCHQPCSPAHHASMNTHTQDPGPAPPGPPCAQTHTCTHQHPQETPSKTAHTPLLQLPQDICMLAHKHTHPTGFIHIFECSQHMLQSFLPPRTAHTQRNLISHPFQAVPPPPSVCTVQTHSHPGSGDQGSPPQICSFPSLPHPPHTHLGPPSLPLKSTHILDPRSTPNAPTRPSHSSPHPSHEPPCHSWCQEARGWALCVCPAENALSHGLASLLQANSPLAASTMGAARTCVCSPTKAMSTAPAEGAASFRRTSPARVRERGGRRAPAGDPRHRRAPSLPRLSNSPIPEAFH